MLRDEKGVSPVVGVILMVAITVVMAAVIASFAFGMGSKIQQVAPQGQFLLEDFPGPVTGRNDNLILITYVSGDEIPASDLRFVVQYKTGTSYSTHVLKYTGSGATWNDSTLTLKSYVNAGRATDVVEPGDQFRLYENNGKNWISSPVPVTVRVIHVPTGSTIFEGTVTVQ